MKTLLLITIICAVGLLLMAIGLLCMGRIRKEAQEALPAELMPTQYFRGRMVLGIFYLIVAIVMVALSYYDILNVLQTVLCVLVALFLTIIGVIVIRHYRTYILLNEIMQKER